MCLGEVFQFFQRGFLKHEIQGFRLIPVRDKHTMMCGEQRVYPQSIACLLYTSHFFSTFVQQYDHISRLESFQYQFPFLFLLHFHGETLGVFQFGDDLDVYKRQEGEVGENFDEAIVQYVMGRIDIARIAVTYRQHLLGVEGV